ncbi:MAG: type VI secretion system protein TssA [Polyangiaceae bacterium]|nr:type VI secretion system protein TssA [Polyangiaceae bacterium]
MSVDEVLSETKSRLEPVLAPINGGVGEDASYDEAFEAIKMELDRASSIEGGSTDWKAVESKAYDLLAERSKDFRVALYYTAAAAQNRKVAGLFEGVLILNELSNAFWEPMFPALKRPRARGALCGWLSEVATPIAQQYAPTSTERAMIGALERTFRELDNFLADKLGDAYPGMNTLRDAVKSLPHRVPADPPPPAPPPAPAAAPAAGPASSGTPSTTAVADAGVSYGGTDTSAMATGGGLAVTEIYDVQTAYQALSEVAPIIGRAGDAILGSDATSADGFRLARVAGWLLVGGMPYNEGGQTQIDGPAEHVTQALIDLAAAQDFQSLLTTSSQVAFDFPLYLDAIRYQVVALQNLDGYATAATAVMRETAALLARAPELPSLTFLNGVAFASGDTKEWAKGLAVGGGGGGAAKSPVDKAAIEADKHLQQGQTAQAIGLLSRVANQVSSPMQKFRARLEIAKACLKGQIIDIALAQLEALERVADEHRLAAWDPELCAEMYANLYRARRAQSMLATDDAELPRKINQALQKLTELDAAQALLAMQEGQV